MDITKHFLICVLLCGYQLSVAARTQNATEISVIIGSYTHDVSSIINAMSNRITTDMISITLSGIDKILKASTHVQKQIKHLGNANKHCGKVQYIILQIVENLGIRKVMKCKEENMKSVLKIFSKVQRELMFDSKLMRKGIEKLKACVHLSNFRRLLCIAKVKVQLGLKVSDVTSHLNETAATAADIISKEKRNVVRCVEKETGSALAAIDRIEKKVRSCAAYKRLLD